MTTVRLAPQEAWTFTRLPLVLGRLGLEPGSVIHIGAHYGEEVEVYRRCGFSNITLVEPDPRSLSILYSRYRDSIDVTVVPFAIVAGDANLVKVFPLYYAQRSVWSSLVPHPSARGETVDVPVVSINYLINSAILSLTRQLGAAVLVVDTQGTELELIKSANLAPFSLVIIEASCRSQDSAAFWLDLVEYMTANNWVLVEEWVHDDSGYTDCVFGRAQ